MAALEPDARESEKPRGDVIYSLLAHRPVAQSKSPKTTMCCIALYSTACRDKRKTVINMNVQVNKMGTF